MNMNTFLYRAKSGFTVGIAALVLALSGCRSDDTVVGEVVQPRELMEYVIGPSDVLSISILNQDAMNRTVTVRPDGMISFPLIEEVSAAGLTPEQLEEVIAVELSEYIEPIPGELTVVVDEVHSYTVSVLGEVRNPGRFEFQNQATVLDALAEAGGLTEFASSDDIVILRNEAGGMRRIRFDYKEVMEDPSNAELSIYPGDTVMVP